MKRFSPVRWADIVTHGKPIAIGFGITIAAVLSYALVARPDAGISANGRNANPPSFPPQLASPLPLETAIVPAGTRIDIRLKEAISTEKNSPGDSFTASLHGPLIVGVKLLASSRCKIIGRLTQVEKADRANGRTQLTMVLSTLVVNGKEYDLETEPLTLVGPGTQKKNAAAIAGSPVAGGAVGLLHSADFGKVYVLATKEAPVAYKPEAHLTFTLSSPAELPVIRTMGSTEVGGKS